MKQTLKEELEEVLKNQISDDPTKEDFVQRLKSGLLTRDENPATHFCVYFLPYNMEPKQVFIVHHKKSNLWLSPGGHIDKDETLLQALNREIEEELGIKGKFKELPQAFFTSTVEIDRPTQACKKHYDVWYLMPTDGTDMNLDPREFHESRWVSPQEAQLMMTDPANVEAMKIVETLS